MTYADSDEAVAAAVVQQVPPPGLDASHGRINLRDGSAFRDRVTLTESPYVPDPRSVTILKRRDFDDRRLYIVGFRATMAKSLGDREAQMEFLAVATRLGDGRWSAGLRSGGGGGGRRPSSEPGIYLCGGAAPGDFVAGGRVDAAGADVCS